MTILRRHPAFSMIATVAVLFLAAVAASMPVPFAGSLAVAPTLEMLQSGSTTRPDLCLTIGLGPDAAYECGNLRLTHDLPGTRTMDRLRTPGLTYHSAHAAPYVLVPVHVTLPASGTTPTVVTAKLTGGGVTLAEGTWTGGDWTPGTTRRITLGFGTALPSGVYSFDIEVTNWYGSTPYTATGSGQYAVVNRSGSPYGAGWWLAGLEALDVATMTVVDGAGGVRRYEAAGSGQWVAQSVDWPDTLVASGSVYIRKLPGNAQVIFDAAGNHIETRNAQGHSTFFAYASGHLSQITLPAPSSPPAYQFTYSAGYMTSVTAPGSRTTTIGRNGAVITSITDPDTRFVSFGSSGNLITSRTDRRATVVTFSYDPQTQRLTQSQLDPAGLGITTALVPSEGRGFANGSTPVASAATADGYTLLDGPRTDVVDQTRFWIDRYGAPSKIRDAAGHETTLTRGYSMFPALVTQTVQPNGFTVQAGYDTRGRITSATQTNPLGNGVDATTTYGWSATCPDYVSQITEPEGEITEFGYDTSCNRIWQQTGGSSRRVNFTYVNGQVTEAWEPAAAQPLRLAYDARGNLSQTTTPRGYLTLAYRDGIGRDTLAITPTDTVSATSAAQLALYGVRTRTVYDAMSRPIEVTSTGPARANCSGCQSAAADTLTVSNTYDQESALTQVFTLGTGNVYTGVLYDYDRAGRRIGQYTSAEQTYDYDPAGNVTAHTIGTGNPTITMEYDALNRRTKRIVPAVQHAKSWCLFCGGRKFPLYPNGPDSSLVVPADTQHFAYDASGNLVEAKNRDAIVRRGHYPNGLLRADTQYIRAYSLDPGDSGAYDSHVYALGYNYDRNGRRTSLTYPENLTGFATWTVQIQYHPDTGALEKIIAPGGQEWSYSYDAAGRDTLRTFPGGVERRGFDADGQLRTRAESTAPLGIFRNDSYRYDGRGKVIYASGGPYTVRHWHSGLGSLIGTVFSGYFDVAQRTDYTEEWIVDALGNVLSTRRHDTGYGSSPPTPFQHYYYEGDRLLWSERDPGATLQVGMTSDEFTNDFDEAGNVTFKNSKRYIVTGSGVWDQMHDAAARSFWSVDNRLVVHQRYADDMTEYGSKREGVYEEYRYDALGRRVLVRARRNDLCSGHSSCHSSITRYVWDGDRILFELNANGSNTLSGSALEQTSGSTPYWGRVAYVHGPELDHPLAIIRDANASTPLVPHTNWRGVPDMGTLPDGTRYTGAVNWPGAHLRSYFDRERESEPIMAWWGSLILEQKDATGLLYRRNRYYDPATGRFTQEDPIGLAGGLNLYGFAAGDPVNFSDPFGLCPPIELCRNIISALHLPLSGGAEGNNVVITRVGYEEVRSGGTRSWRNYNPGNITAGGFATRHGSVGAAGGFGIFPDLTSGEAAKIGLLKSESYVELTLDAAIARWAPPNGNPTATYQAFVARRSGITGTTVLSSLSDAEIARIADAMRVFEGWREGQVELRPRR